MLCCLTLSTDIDTQTFSEIFKYGNILYTHSNFDKKNLIQKEEMYLLPNLLIQSLQVFKISIDLGLIYCWIKDKEGGGV